MAHLSSGPSCMCTLAKPFLTSRQCDHAQAPHQAPVEPGVVVDLGDGCMYVKVRAWLGCLSRLFTGQGQTLRSFCIGAGLGAAGDLQLFSPIRA